LVTLKVPVEVLVAAGAVDPDWAMALVTFIVPVEVLVAPDADELL
jgi:hypothetical protein